VEKSEGAVIALSWYGLRRSGYSGIVAAYYHGLNWEGRRDDETKEDLVVAMRSSALGATDDALTEKIIGTAITVHKALGPGLLEGIYQKSLAAELRKIDLRLQRERLFPVYYRGARIGEQRLDLIVEDKVVLELKAVEALAQVHRAQLLTYLRVSDLPIGLLINFGSQFIQVKRVLNTPQGSSSSLRPPVPPG